MKKRRHYVSQKLRTRQETWDILSAPFYQTRERREMHEHDTGLSGYVYILDTGDGMYKIGQTVDLHRRAMELSAANPRARMVFSRFKKDRRMTEKEAHRKFCQNNISGGHNNLHHKRREVFSLTPDELETAKRFIESH